MLGGGAFSRVSIVTEESTGRQYALKRMRKSAVVQCPEHVFCEQTITRNTTHPFCIRQYGSFQVCAIKHRPPALCVHSHWHPEASLPAAHTCASIARLGGHPPSVDVRGPLVTASRCPASAAALLYLVLIWRFLCAGQVPPVLPVRPDGGWRPHGCASGGGQGHQAPRAPEQLAPSLLRTQGKHSPFSPGLYQ